MEGLCDNGGPRETSEFKKRRTTHWSLAPQDSAHSEAARSEFVCSLYENITFLFQALLTYLRNETNEDRTDLSKPLRRGLEDTYFRLLLWARDHGLKEGRLDEILQESQSARRLTMRVLLKISGTLGQDILPLLLLEPGDELKSKSPSNEQLSFQVDIMRSKARLLNNVAEEAASRVPPDVEFGEDGDEGNDFMRFHGDETSLENAIRNLEEDVGLLEDLSPLIEDAIPDMDTPESDAEYARHSALEASGSLGSVLDIFRNRVQAKFPSCHEGLLDVLAKANYETFLHLQAEREVAQRQRENPVVQITVTEEMPSVMLNAAAPAINVFNKAPTDSGVALTSAPPHLAEEQAATPAAFLTPGANVGRIRDSALGTSIYGPSRSGINLDERYTAGDPSICGDSILSLARDGVRRTKFPSQPRHLAVGQLFPCMACGQDVQKSSDDRAWKRHLLSDLKPWICCQVACRCIREPSTRAVFETRREWVDHLKALHKVNPDWDDKTCPFCAKVIRTGRHTVIRHIEQHMHEASLAALPPEQSNEEEMESDDESDASADAARDSDPPVRPPRSQTGERKWFHQHPVYIGAALDPEDGLWHCPWEPEDFCDHKPTVLRAEFDQWVEEHLESLRCKVEHCENSARPFATVEILRLHEQKIHGMHKIGGRFLCPSSGCGRSRKGNGFASQWVLEEHVRDVHENLPDLLAQLRSMA